MAETAFVEDDGWERDRLAALARVERLMVGRLGRLRLEAAEAVRRLQLGVSRGARPTLGVSAPVGAQDWPRVSVVAGRVFRSMLPSGFHCESCHGLVRVYEANVYGYQFEGPAVVALLEAHVEFVCRGGRG